MSRISSVVEALNQGFLLAFTICELTGCARAIVPSITNVPSPQKDELLFQTSFEGDQVIIPIGNNGKLVGRDSSLLPPNDMAEREKFLSNGQFTFNYTGGDSTKRFAKIVRDPINPQNKVLQFRILTPWSAETGAEKARVQYDFYGLKKGLKSFKQSVKVFLPNDISFLQNYPNKITWMTIAEFWNNITWSQTVPHGFRVTLGIGKLTAAPGELHFILDAQDCELFADGRQKYTTLWSEKNQEVKVPIGQWFTLTYSYVEGNDKTGNFFMTVDTDNRPQVVFDVHGFTHNSKDSNPNGLTEFNPMKLYTSKELVNYMKNQGKTLDIYWDDLKIWKLE